MNKKKEMNEKFTSIIQIMHVQKTILELELIIGEGIPLEQLKTSIKKVDMLFEDKGILNDVRCAMDSLEINEERFKEIINALINAGEIKINDDGEVIRVSLDKQVNSIPGNKPVFVERVLTPAEISEVYNLGEGRRWDKTSFYKKNDGSWYYNFYIYKFKFKLKGKEIVCGINANTDKEAIKLFLKERGLVEFTCKVYDGREFNHKGGWRNLKSEK